MAELSCGEAEELLSLAALGALEQRDGAVLDGHLARCDSCRRLAREFQGTAALLSASLEPVDPPETLRRRLLSEVYGQRRAPARGSLWQRLWERIPQGRPLTVAGACAVVAAVALGVWGATRAAAPAEVSYAVVGTTTAPQAHGTLTYLPATGETVVTVTGMGVPPPTGTTPSVYELWLISPGGVAHAAGFLSEQPATGQWTAAMHTNLADYVAVAGTTEPYGGSPQPTGPQLFSVNLDH